MSQFQQERRGGSDLFREIIGRDPSLPLQEDELKFLNRVFGEWGPIPLGFRAGLKGWLATELPPEIPIFQLQGFSQFTAIPATTILTSEATASTSYVDLATVGPELTELSKGRYVIFFGAQIAAGADIGIVSVSINGAAASDDDVFNADGNVSSMRALAKTLTQTSNSLRVKYRSNAGGSISFLRRWLIALRYGNV